MRLLRSFPLMCFALVLLSIVGACVAMKSVTFLLLVGTIAAMSWYVTEGPRGRHVPRWVSNVLIIIVSLNVFIELLNTGQGMVEVISVLGRFIVWLTLIKLYERKAVRDYVQLMALSLMLMIIGSIVSSDLLFGAVLFIYAVLGLYVLLLFQLHAGFERLRNERQETIPVDYRLPPTVKPIIGRGVGLHFRGLVVAIAVVGLISSTAVFLVIPRHIGTGFASSLARQLAPGSFRTQTGFSETVDLHTAARVDSRRTIMNVQVLDRNGRPIRMPEPLLLRGETQESVSRDGRWEPAPDRRRSEQSERGPNRGAQRTIDIEPDVPTPLWRTENRIEPTHTLDVTLLAPVNRVFSMGTPLTLTFDRPQTLETDNWSLTLRNRRGAPLRSRGYTLDVRATPLWEDEGEDEGEIVGYRWRNWHAEDRFPDSAAMRNLIYAILDDAGVSHTQPPPSRSNESGMQAMYNGAPRNDPVVWQWRRDVTDALHRYLRNGPFQYSVDLSDITINTGDDNGSPHGGPRERQVRQFLFETRRGDCNYFATALAAMCHVMGIPARVVTGYVAYEYDESNRAYIVRQSNAHAWVEVRANHRSWSVYDPTPESVVEELHSAPESGGLFADRLRWLYDRFEYAWQTEIVQYDRHAQQSIADSLHGSWSEAVGRATTWVRDRIERYNRTVVSAVGSGIAGYIWLGVAALLIIIWIVVIAYIWRRMRRVRTQLGLESMFSRRSRQMIRQLGFYVDMLRVLKSAGLTKPQWQPPHHFALSLQSARPEISSIVQRITRLFYTVRFGERPLSQDEQQQANQLVRELALHVNERRNTGRDRHRQR